MASIVSHVVNRTRPVRPETARLVRAAIAEVGFTPNSLARSLKRASSNSVGRAISALSRFGGLSLGDPHRDGRLGLAFRVAAKVGASRPIRKTLGTT
jgi:hypothetical protein